MHAPADVLHAFPILVFAHSVVRLLAQLEAERPPVPKLAICIMIAGTRGDVQPFIALGIKLKVRNRELSRCAIGLPSRPTWFNAQRGPSALLQGVAGSAASVIPAACGTWIARCCQPGACDIS